MTSLKNTTVVSGFTKRIIPCLDIQDGRTVKGTQFLDLRDAGDPVELAMRYSREGADELVFLDITATTEKRKTLTTLVREIATHLNIPFTVGGGIHSVKDVSLLLENGADKITVNTSAVNNPDLIDELAKNFGSQCIVLSIDTRRVEGTWRVVTHGGRTPTPLDTLKWAREASDRGAGEILLTSMENDGAQTGFALEITRTVAHAIPIPLIASGGAGSEEHFREVFETTEAEAALAAGIFHFGKMKIPGLKKYLREKNIPVRI